MKILITSGGSKVPIDPVRHIANHSTGRFASALAKEALESGAEVLYLAAANAQSPFACSFDFNQSTPWETNVERLHSVFEFSELNRDRYEEVRYNTFTDYTTALKR